MYVISRNIFCYRTRERVDAFLSLRWTEIDMAGATVAIAVSLQVSSQSFTPDDNSELQTFYLDRSGPFTLSNSPKWYVLFMRLVLCLVLAEKIGQ
jgi:hypothetical protein